NDYFKRILMEKQGSVSFDEVLAADEAGESNPESNRTVAAFVHGDLENNSITAGQGAAIIKDIPSCRELMDRMVAEAKPVLARLNAMWE
ncbi:MAG: hypothetical protein GY866_07330, partial [Proteobacteria bacterium]|nr:hypothetical protein [Pseudomonadota bacterium]